MEGAISNAINKFSEIYDCQFVNYSYGLYDFKDKDGNVVYSLTQRDLLKMTRDY